MAMNVSFKKGLAAQLPASRDANTFYYVTDTFALYLGNNLVSNEVTLAQYNALAARVKALEDANFQGQIDSITETLNSDILPFESRIAEIEKDYLTSSDKTELQNNINAKTTTAAVKAQIEAYGYAKASDLGDLATKNEADLNLAQYTTEQEVKDIVDSVIAGAADDETYNSLTKLVDYIDAHGGEAAEMAEAIEALEGKVSTIESKPAYDITDAQIEAWTTEVGAKSIASDVKNQIEGYGDIVSHNASEFATAAQGALAASALQKADITTGTANGTISVEGTNVAVKGLGTAAYTASTAYATAAQGTKADNAVQSIKIGDKIFTVTSGAASITQADARTALGLGTAAYQQSGYFALASDLTALTTTVNNNAETCTNNFNTIVTQLTWGSF